VFTLFVPGLESGPVETLPALQRLLARGRSRPLEISPWEYLAALAGGDMAAWPVGPVSALGELVAPPRCCLRVEPLGAEHEQQSMFRMPATALHIERYEAEALAVAFHEAFGADGLRLAVAAPERWYLAWEAGHAGAIDWRGFAAPAGALDPRQRPAPPEAALRLVLSEIEMLFHAHPVNAARRDRGAPVIAGLHPWGGGALHSTAARPGPVPAVTEEPYLAGLRRLDALPGEAGARFDAGAMDAGGIAWPVPTETLAAAPLAEVEQAWAAPLLAALQRGRLAGVRIVTGRAVHETRRMGALCFWRRSLSVADPA
jgi:hypothetical protein